MNRPQWNREQVEAVIAQKFAQANRKIPSVVLLGVRGYYEDSMGKPNQNDRGIYDDALFIITPNEFESFNFNTDPSRSGLNKNVGKGFAVLQPGIYDYKIGIHGISKPESKQYRAFIQAGKVTIKRDGSDKIERVFIGLNLHRGGVGTSSEACQTVVKEQWDEFFELAEKLLIQYEQTTVPYCLIEQQG